MFGANGFCILVHYQHESPRCVPDDQKIARQTVDDGALLSGEFDFCFWNFHVFNL